MENAGEGEGKERENKGEGKRGKKGREGREPIKGWLIPQRASMFQILKNTLMLTVRIWWNLCRKWRRT